MPLRAVDPGLSLELSGDISDLLLDLCLGLPKQLFFLSDLVVLLQLLLKNEVLLVQRLDIIEDREESLALDSQEFLALLVRVDQTVLFIEPLDNIRRDNLAVLEARDVLSHVDAVNSIVYVEAIIRLIDYLTWEVLGLIEALKMPQLLLYVRITRDLIDNILDY